MFARRVLRELKILRNLEHENVIYTIDILKIGVVIIGNPINRIRLQ